MFSQTLVPPPPGTDPGSFGPPEINQPSTQTPSINISPFNTTNQCGLSLYGNQQFTESGFKTEVGFVYTSNPCTNQENIEKIKQKSSFEQKQIDRVIEYNTECIRGRTQAVVAGKNPDHICAEPTIVSK
ncbi:hypothetical protein HC766_04050 [Candidatus Gracilibacteria bacterium]|nr:hypothetical protein [Candidatus Gracilibacteria bacterium]NJS41501.1 hypothetical protein [Candidatus Gracilibacteria bacterium]